MSAPEFKSCLDCISHRLIGKTGHLCVLPPECLPPPSEEEAADLADMEGRISEGGSEYIGAICDRMRSMGAACGPRAALWEAKA